jgi:hypothetical protein
VQKVRNECIHSIAAASAPVHTQSYSLPHTPTRRLACVDGVCAIAFANATLPIRRFNIRPGFYFSLASSAIFDVSDNKVLNSSLIPGQVRVTQAEYETINLAQLEELWSTYGADAEIWFDGGFSSTIEVRLKALIAKYQPNAPALNGYGVSNNPLRYVQARARPHHVFPSTYPLLSPSSFSLLFSCLHASECLFNSYPASHSLSLSHPVARSL